ncbi:MAG: class I SAM-dependent methyltransferase [Phycisphaeraceae bacterium]
MMFNARVQGVMDEVDALRERVDDHWQIPRDEALVLAQIARAARCTSFCEIGVSYGYSTLHLAAVAAERAGRVEAIDIDPRKIEHASDHLRQAGLDGHVRLHAGDAAVVLPTLKPERPFDFVFIDADKPQCPVYLEAV